MENEIMMFNRFGLSTNSQYSYSEVANAFIGEGYTSQAGNTYFNAIKLAEGIVVKEDIGEGYAYTFLNGLRVYGIKSNTLLCEKYYYSCVYNKSYVKSEVVDMLTNIIIDAAEKEKIQVSSYEIHKQLNALIEKSFETDQRKMLESQSQKYLM